MLTMIYSFYALGAIGGMEPWILFWAACLALYLAIFLFLNRTKKGRKNVLIGLLLAEIVFDLVWAVIYSFNKVFIEFGVGITYGLFMWGALLLAAGVAATVKTVKQ